MGIEALVPRRGRRTFVLENATDLPITPPAPPGRAARGDPI